MTSPDSQHPGTSPPTPASHPSPSSPAAQSTASTAPDAATTASRTRSGSPRSAHCTTTLPRLLRPQTLRRQVAQRRDPVPRPPPLRPHPQDAQHRPQLRRTAGKTGTTTSPANPRLTRDKPIGTPPGANAPYQARPILESTNRGRHFVRKTPSPRVRSLWSQATVQPSSLREPSPARAPQIQHRIAFDGQRSRPTSAVIGLRGTRSPSCLAGRTPLPGGSCSRIRRDGGGCSRSSRMRHGMPARGSTRLTSPSEAARLG